jgi:hypothetical protein
VSSQKAHWYLIILPTNTNNDCNELCSIFPPLSYLLNIEEHVLRGVLIECKLLKRNAKGKGHGHVTLLQELWANFIDQFGINLEWTISKIGGGSRLFFIRVGSWSKEHPFMTPQQIWKKKENYKIPRLRVDRLTQDVARAIGEMNLHQVLDP